MEDTPAQLVSNAMIEKRYALITGASSGLGAEFAQQLAALGHPLILVARREEKLTALASTLREQYGVAVEVIAADLSQPETPQKIAALCSASGWQVDWLINNAGVAGPDLLKDRDWSEQYAFYQLMML